MANIMMNETDEGFVQLLDNTMLAVTENISTYHIFFNAALAGLKKKNNVAAWVYLATRIANTSYRTIKDETFLSDEFILMLALRLAKHFKADLDRQLNHQQ